MTPMLPFPSDNERVLAALQERPGKWVGKLYARTHCMVHSRVADLRKRGHVIECRRNGRDYEYRLVERTEANV